MSDHPLTRDTPLSMSLRHQVWQRIDVRRGGHWPGPAISRQNLSPWNQTAAAAATFMLHKIKPFGIK